MRNLTYHGTYNHYLILHALNCLFVQVLVYSSNQFRKNGILQVNSGGTSLWKPMLLRRRRKSNVFYDTRTCACTLHDAYNVCQTIKLLNCEQNKCRNKENTLMTFTVFRPYSRGDGCGDMEAMGSYRLWWSAVCIGLKNYWGDIFLPSRSEAVRWHYGIFYPHFPHWACRWPWGWEKV